MEATPFVSAGGENKRRRSDRNHPLPANSQIILYSGVDRSQTYQSPMLMDDVTIKLKPKLSKERVLLLLA